MLFFVMALTLRVVMAWLSVRVYISTDLTPKRRVYINCLTSYIDLHTTSFVNNIQSLRTSSARTMTFFIYYNRLLKFVNKGVKVV